MKTMDVFNIKMNRIKSNVNYIFYSFFKVIK